MLFVFPENNLLWFVFQNALEDTSFKQPVKISCHAYKNKDLFKYRLKQPNFKWKFVLLAEKRSYVIFFLVTILVEHIETPWKRQIW